MITGTSDFGVTFTRATSLSGTYSDFGRYMDVGFPDISMDEVPATNHASAGDEEFLMSRLTKLSDFDVIFLMDSSVVKTAYDDLRAATTNFYKILFPNSSSKAAWNFEAFTKGVKVDKSADATKPNTLRVTVTFRATHGITSGLS